MSKRKIRIHQIAIGLGIALLALNAHADLSTCATDSNNTQQKIQNCVTVDGVRAHQAAFQAIADANGGTRAAGTPGYAASVDYVVDTLTAAGYSVELQQFDFTFVPPSTLQQTAPIVATYDTGIVTGSGVGMVSGPVLPVDLALGNIDWPNDPSTSTSGCEASDFIGIDFSGTNDIALIQRGTCLFSIKALNAETAGAEAVILFNQGNTPSRFDSIDITLLPSNVTIPVVFTSFAAGVNLSQVGSQAFVKVDPNVIVPQHNVIAELPGDNSNVIIAGAHLDSVLEGPGIQDNGSGSAALLETAVQMSLVDPRNTIRFSWWGAGDAGLLGSQTYIDSLSQEELDSIALYLNFDMIGSPNYVFFIYDGDDSDGIGFGPGPEGSAAIEAFYENFYTQQGRPFKGTDLLNPFSDQTSFLIEEIPVGGIFTGANGVKTPDEASIWGGTAGDQYDPCYHLACDTFDNISLEALDVNSDAVAASILQFGMNTEAVNGKKGKGNFKPPK